jgi:hypothetical protein
MQNVSLCNGYIKRIITSVSAQQSLFENIWEYNSPRSLIGVPIGNNMVA